MRSDITKIKWFFIPARMQLELKTENIWDKAERLCVQNILRGRVITTSCVSVVISVIRLPMTDTASDSDWWLRKSILFWLWLTVKTEHSLKLSWCWSQCRIVVYSLKPLTPTSRHVCLVVVVVVVVCGGTRDLRVPRLFVTGFIMLTHWLAVWSSNTTQLPPYLASLLNPWSFTIW